MDRDVSPSFRLDLYHSNHWSWSCQISLRSKRETTEKLKIGILFPPIRNFEDRLCLYEWLVKFNEGYKGSGEFQSSSVHWLKPVTLHSSLLHSVGLGSVNLRIRTKRSRKEERTDHWLLLRTRSTTPVFYHLGDRGSEAYRHTSSLWKSRLIVYITSTLLHSTQHSPGPLQLQQRRHNSDLKRTDYVQKD